MRLSLVSTLFILSAIQFACGGGSSSRSSTGGRCWSSDIISMNVTEGFQKASISGNKSEGSGATLASGNYEFAGAEMVYIKSLRGKVDPNKSDPNQRLYFVALSEEQQKTAETTDDTRVVCVSEITQGQAIGPFNFESAASVNVSESGEVFVDEVVNLEMGFDGTKLIHSAKLEKSSSSTSLNDFYTNQSITVVQNTSDKNVVEVRHKMADAKGGYEIYLETRFKRVEN